MGIEGKTILLVSDDAAFCVTARRELEGKEPGCRVAAVSTIEAACRVVTDVAPAVILLEGTAGLLPGGDERGSQAKGRPSLEAVVTALGTHAPVVIIGDAEQERELGALAAAGVIDFVMRARRCLAQALDLVQQRLHRSPELATAALHAALSDETVSEAFGEVLRHELNNPLTGILGNAELLLAEVRRKNDGQLPNGGQQRLETIAALAVRLRETVRRLSQEWESRHHPGPHRAAVQHRTAL
jgi:signal transduction histidine kinase